VTLGLFNFVLLCLGLKQLSWAISFTFPALAGGATQMIARWGLSDYVSVQTVLAFLVCAIAAYSKGARWRAFGLALLLVNNLALGSFALVVAGVPTSAMWNATIDMLIAAYLAFIMAVHAYDQRGTDASTT
jgi:hypothetical protein